jgi:hypothetical protein
MSARLVETEAIYGQGNRVKKRVTKV